MRRGVVAAYPSSLVDDDKVPQCLSCYGILTEGQAASIPAQDCELAARQGSFYFRWAGGESGADVYDRLSQMIASLYREWEQPARAQNYVLLTHDMTIRVFLMRWFRWDVETFHRLRKLKTGQFVVMERQDDGAYKLTAPIPSFSPGPPSRNFVEGTVGKGWRATLKQTPSMIQDDPRLAVIPWGSVDEKIQEAEAKKKQKELDPAVERK